MNKHGQQGQTQARTEGRITLKQDTVVFGRGYKQINCNMYLNIYNFKTNKGFEPETTGCLPFA